MSNAHTDSQMATSTSDRPDLTGYHLIHRAIVGEAQHLASIADLLASRRQVRTFRWLWRGFSGELHCHHTAEDRVMFPALVERLGSAALFERTGVDHAHLDELLEHVDVAVAASRRPEDIAAIAPVIAELATIVVAHFGYEDVAILPLFAELFTAAEYERLEEGVMEVLGVSRQALFTVPFALRWATPDERAASISSAPAAFAVMYRLTRGRHERRMRRLPGRDLARAGRSLS